MQYSDYELVRLENIDKNNRFLSDIGFNVNDNKSNNQILNKIPKKKRVIEYSEPIRKSGRFIDKEPVNYKEVSQQSFFRYTVFNKTPLDQLQVSDLTKLVSKQTNDIVISKVNEAFDENDENMEHNIRGQFIGSEALQTDDTRTKVYNTSSSSSSSSNSSSSSGINATKSLFLQSYLCKPVEQFGKAAVMSMSNGGSTPRFSKYSGVVEWRNAVYLWVNIGGKTGYRNSFSEGGRFIMWFGGSRMHAGGRSAHRNILILKINLQLLCRLAHNITIVADWRHETQTWCCSTLLSGERWGRQ
jgi:hypothetical protein